MPLQNYDPSMGLYWNLGKRGLVDRAEGDTNFQGTLNPAFVAAIESAFQRAGDLGLGGQQAFNLISGADAANTYSDPMGYAQQLMQGTGVTPYSSQNEMNQYLNTARHTGTMDNLGSALGGAASTIASVPGELLKNPGVAQFLAVAGLGAGMGHGLFGGGGGSAAGAGSTTAAAGSAPTPLFSTPASMGTNAFGGTFSTPAMTTFAGPTGTALGGFSAPAVLGTTGTGFGTAAALGAEAPMVSAPAPLTSAGPAAIGGGAATSSGIAGILSNPMTLGMAGGALLGGMGGAEQAGTITTEESLPDWLMPYAKPQLDRYATDLQNYQIDPYGVMPSAMKEFQNTISGMYLDPSQNKYLGDYFRLGAERIKGALSPSFGHMNAFGGHSGYNEALARGLGDFSTQLYGGAYDKERDRQSQMTAAAPSFIGQSGTAAFAPFQQYLTTLGSLGSKKQQPFFDNPMGDILGGAMTGGSLGWMFGGGGKK